MIKVQKKNMFHLIVSSSIPFLSLQIANANQFKTPSSPSLSYEWYEGSNTINTPGTYGTLGAASGSNIPGGKVGSTMSAGGATNYNVWLFGGNSIDSVGSTGKMNDLWLFDAASGNWTWKSGSQNVFPTSYGVYGTKGTPASSNVPGARTNSVSWTDSNGDFWLFGGSGYDSVNTHAANVLNDLWKYDSTTDEWVWLKGANVIAQKGTYGTKGTAASGNTPGARYNSLVAIDSSNNLWLLGGYGYDNMGGQGYLNDLWKYDPTTNNWTWISGSSTAGASPVFGIKGTAASSNVPGTKSLGQMWFDASGNLWIFGGYGKSSSGTIGNMNDLWKFNTTSKMWTWMSGATTVAQTGVYGSQGVSSSSNVPGARNAYVSWKDTDGNFWIFGGIGVDSLGSGGFLNDLWQYNMTSSTWIWQGGENTANQTGTWGSLGSSSSANEISPRANSSSFFDANGDLWLFGGLGKDSNGVNGYLNDLWKITY